MQFQVRAPLHFIFFLLAVSCLGCNPSDRSTAPVAWTVITTPTQSATINHVASTLPIEKSNTPTVIVQSAGTRPNIQFKSWEIVHDLAYSPDGLLLAVSAGDFVHIYDAVSLYEKVKIPVGSWTNQLSFHPFLPLIVLAVRDGTIQFRNTSTGEVVCQFTAHEKGANSISVHPDGKILATTGTDITSRLWDIASLSEGKCEVSENGKLIGRSYRSPVISFSPDGSSIALIDLTDIRLRNSTDRKLIALLEGELPIFDITFSPDGQWLAAAANQGRVALWALSHPSNLNWSSLYAVEINPKAHFWQVAFNPDSSILAAGDSDGVVTLWSVATFMPMKNYRLPRAVSALAFSPDGKILAAGGLDASVWLFPLTP